MYRFFTSTMNANTVIDMGTNKVEQLQCILVFEGHNLMPSLGFESMIASRESHFFSLR